MDMSMTDEEIKQYLSQPILARIATSGKANKPLVHPIWFIYENGELIMSTGRDSAKAKNIKANPSVAIAIDSTQGEMRHKGAIFRGKAELSIEEALETTKRIYGKYMKSLEHNKAQTREAIFMGLHKSYWLTQDFLLPRLRDVRLSFF
jgi:nitroimidazol reductase NimA-like FMN-containing flavoprotein (pyridoxamine 5'-phosphate oxidase superfamily)